MWMLRKAWNTVQFSLAAAFSFVGALFACALVLSKRDNNTENWHESRLKAFLAEKRRVITFYLVARAIC